MFDDIKNAYNIEYIKLFMTVRKEWSYLGEQRTLHSPAAWGLLWTHSYNQSVTGSPSSEAQLSVTFSVPPNNSIPFSLS